MDSVWGEYEKSLRSAPFQHIKDGGVTIQMFAKRENVKYTQYFSIRLIHNQKADL